MFWKISHSFSIHIGLIVREPLTILFTILINVWDSTKLTFFGVLFYSIAGMIISRIEILKKNNGSRATGTRGVLFYWKKHWGVNGYKGPLIPNLQF